MRVENFFSRLVIGFEKILNLINRMWVEGRKHASDGDAFDRSMHDVI